MSSEPIVFYNRYSGELETEVVYGEGFLRWAYENPLGRAMTWALVKRAAFSHWYGWRMNQPASRDKIAPFISQYQISTDEMLDKPEEFPHFNAFFSRRLKVTARPVAADARLIVFPADGRHFVIPNISVNDGIFVKGIPFDLVSLLGDPELAAKFAGGSLVISRLCPVDYHRFHFPVDGVPGLPRLINGPLYSVSPIALRQRPSLLWENKRFVTSIQSENLGEVLLLEVGATCVGSVVHTAPVGSSVMKGDEKGYFLFGGSCVMTIFEPGKIKLSEDLIKNSEAGREVYARMGDVMGTMV